MEIRWAPGPAAVIPLFLSLLLLSSPKADDAPVASASCGGVVRLDEAGGPLASARVQSQDGIGSCASNALALLLEGALPGHPAVSFLDLAFHDPDVRERAIVPKSTLHATPSPSPSRDPEVLAFWGANVCEQFEQAAAVGGACPRGAVPLESAVAEAAHSPLRDVNDLQWVLEGLGRLFDEGLGTDEGNRVWETELLPTIDRSRSEVEAVLARECDPAAPMNLLLPGIFATMAREIEAHLKIQREQLEKRALALSSNLKNWSPERIEAEAHSIRLLSEIIDARTSGARWLRDPPLEEIRQNLLERFQGGRSLLDPANGKGMELSERMQLASDTLAGWLRESIPSGSPVLDPLLEEYWSQDGPGFRSLVISLGEMADPAACRSKSYRIWALARDAQSCTIDDSRNPLRKMASALVGSGIDVDALLSKLPSARKTGDATDWFVETIAPACADPSNRVSFPPSMRCRTDAWRPPGSMAVKVPRLRRLALEEFGEQLRMGIHAGRPQAVSMCSAVLADFAFDGMHDLENGCGSRAALPGHGRHALVAIGYRSVPDPAGSGGCRREVLVQNSWGMDWCSEHNAGKPSEADFPCRDGKLWMPEEALAKNAYALSEIVDSSSRNQGASR